jgi:CheY-like chemotaxis protein
MVPPWGLSTTPSSAHLYAWVAYEGFAVVPVAERFGPDVCILDVKMPGISGWEIARRLRNGVGGKRLLLIAVTGVQGQESADNSVDAGFDRHFVKPAAPADLLAELTAFAQESLLCPLDGT